MREEEGLCVRVDLYESHCGDSPSSWGQNVPKKEIIES